MSFLSARDPEYIAQAQEVISALTNTSAKTSDQLQVLLPDINMTQLTMLGHRQGWLRRVVNWSSPNTVLWSVNRNMVCNNPANKLLVTPETPLKASSKNRNTASVFIQGAGLLPKEGLERKIALIKQRPIDIGNLKNIPSTTLALYES